jgi:hypothetical protein
MKRLIAGTGIGLALAAAAVFLPNAVVAAPTYAGGGTVRLASLVQTHVVGAAVARAQVAHQVTASRVSHAVRINSQVNRSRVAGALTARGRHGTGRNTGLHYASAMRYGAHTYARMGYARSAHYGAAGTTHHCPNMGTSTSTGK